MQDGADAGLKFTRKLPLNLVINFLFLNHCDAPLYHNLQVSRYHTYMCIFCLEKSAILRSMIKFTRSLTNRTLIGFSTHPSLGFKEVSRKWEQRA